MATKKTTERIVEIPAIDIQTATIKVVGDSALIVHKWSEKAKKGNSGQAAEEGQNKRS